MNMRRGISASLVLFAVVGIGLLGPRPAPLPLDGATVRMAEFTAIADGMSAIVEDRSIDPGETCTVRCTDALHTCTWYEHDAWVPTNPEATTTNEVGEGAHDGAPCWVGHCTDQLEDPYDPEVIHPPKHPACCPGSGGPDPDLLGNCDPENVAALTENADAGNLDGVRSALALLGSNAITIVPERSAVQMHDCDGHVILHLPLSASLLNGLVAE